MMHIAGNRALTVSSQIVVVHAAVVFCGTLLIHPAGARYSLPVGYKLSRHTP
jgi:hypothetical protein